MTGSASTMRNTYQLTAALIIVCVVSMIVPVIGSEPQTKKTFPTEKMLVAASILPLGDFARNVGGDYVTVEVIIPPGASPHTFEPTPGMMRKLVHTRVFVLNGVGLEFWSEKVIKAIESPDLVVVRSTEGLEIIHHIGSNEPQDNAHEKTVETKQHASTEEKSAGQHRRLVHLHEEGNPHVWLDPVNAIHQAEKIRDAFITADPLHSEAYKRNAKNYIEKLKKLDDEIRHKVHTFSSKKFAAFHAAYTYFARRYGLEQVAVVEKSPGREPSAREIARIIKDIRKSRVKVIFAEPQFSSKAAKVIAIESGVQFAYLDPLGSDVNDTYLKLMHANLKELEKALK